MSDSRMENRPSTGGWLMVISGVLAGSATFYALAVLLGYAVVR